MPRLPRIELPGYPQHLVQRGHSRQPCFADEQDYRTYRDYLGEAARRYGCEVHAYVLMTNHVHLLVTPRHKQAITRMMQLLGRRYVRDFNSKYRKSGSLWEGRYKSSLVDSEAYLLSCSRYIELNPVRAGMVTRPERYRWSSHGGNAMSEQDALLTHHTLYLALGVNAEERRRHYRELFRTDPDQRSIAEIRASLNKNVALGSDRFKAQVETLLGRRVTPAKMGRPRKHLEPR